MTDLFGFRPKGSSDPFASKARDILSLTPELLVKAAVFAADPESSPHQNLERRKPGASKAIRTHLEYLLGVLHSCRSAPLEEVLDSSRVDEDVFQAIMEALGVMVLRTYNRTYRTFRFTDTKGGVTDPTDLTETARAMSVYDSLLKQVTGG